MASPESSRPFDAVAHEKKQNEIATEKLTQLDKQGALEAHPLVVRIIEEAKTDADKEVKRLQALGQFKKLYAGALDRIESRLAAHLREKGIEYTRAEEISKRAMADVLEQNKYRPEAHGANS